MLAVPSHSYTVSEAEGEMYFCNSRCLCLWAMMLVTKPNPSTDDVSGPETKLVTLRAGRRYIASGPVLEAVSNFG
jgi:hypothetical protein